MNLFSIYAGTEEIVSIFAETLREAELIYVAWATLTDGKLPPEFEIRLRNPCYPGHAGPHLTAAFARNIEGVGHYDPLHGWRIVPLHDLGQESGR